MKRKFTRKIMANKHVGDAQGNAQVIKETQIKIIYQTGKD